VCISFYFDNKNIFFKLLIKIRLAVGEIHQVTIFVGREFVIGIWNSETNQTCHSVRALSHSHSCTCTQQHHHHASTPTFLEQKQQPRHSLYHLVHLFFSNKTLFFIPNPNYNSNALPPQFVVLVLLYPLSLSWVFT
jgi:hypothetical protein